MSHAFQASDEQYERLETYAREHGKTPQELFDAWLDSVPSPWTAIDLAGEPPPTEEELRESPFLRVMGSLSVGIPGWAERHDEAFGAGELLDEDADK